MIHTTLSLASGYLGMTSCQCMCAKHEMQGSSPPATICSICPSCQSLCHKFTYNFISKRQDQNTRKITVCQRQDLARLRQKYLSHASDDAADEYPVDKAKLPSSWCHLPRICQSCGTASPAICKHASDKDTHWEWSNKLLLFTILAFGSWIPVVSYNEPGLVLYTGIGDRIKGQWIQLVTIVSLMIIDSYQKLKDSYNALGSLYYGIEIFSHRNIHYVQWASNFSSHKMVLLLCLE